MSSCATPPAISPRPSRPVAGASNGLAGSATRLSSAPATTPITVTAQPPAQVAARWPAAPFENNGLVNCYLIDAPRRALIDTGTSSVPQASLVPALAELGWQLSDLRIIINTHIHIDHAGGNAEMLELSGGAIHIHRADAEYTDRERYLEKYCRDSLRLMSDTDQIPQSEAFQLQLLGREWGVDRRLEEGDVVDLGGDI